MDALNAHKLPANRASSMLYGDTQDLRRSVTHKAGDHRSRGPLAEVSGGVAPQTVRPEHVGIATLVRPATRPASVLREARTTIAFPSAGGRNENSPAFQRWEHMRPQSVQVPEGRLMQFRDDAAQALQSALRDSMVAW